MGSEMCIRDRHCNGQSKLKCDICDKFETNRRDNLKRHRLRCINQLCKGVFHNSNAASQVTSTSCNRTNYPCDICNRPHVRMSDLIEHRNIHSATPTGFVASFSNDFLSLE